MLARMSADLNNSKLTHNDVNYVSNGNEIETKNASAILHETDLTLKLQCYAQCYKTLEKELKETRQENRDYRLVYMDISRKLEISKTNVTILLETARAEIRKKDLKGE